ncbi:MAG TPA: hypothetical protein VNK23_15890 [Candidatus Dormibacteraeota bacterium]|nr:hypothetical protein [Candidatus Dormibacteraeota bacterium]
MKKKIRAALLTAAGLAALGPIFVAHRYFHEERMVDDCLSGRHGSFDYSTMTCDLNENHLYVPYSVRHPNDGSIFLIGSAACALFLSGYAFVKTVGKNV